MEVRLLEHQDRGWAEGLVRDHFGSSRVVSRGRLHETADLSCLAAYVDGGPVGLLHYRVDDSSDWEVVTLIFARPSCGIGTALIDAAVDRARAAGCRRLWLVTTNDNTVAQHFYRSRGWSEVEVHLGAVRLARELKPEIPLVGQNGAPIADEIEFELGLRA